MDVVAVPAGSSAAPAVPPRDGTRTPGRGSRLGTAVVQKLVDDIVGGTFPPRSTLPTEADLGALFDVSRTVVRESVKVVQEKGLVRILQGKGTEVTDQRDWNMIDPIVLDSLTRQDETLSILDELITVRTALEREMAGSAALVGTPEGKQRIADALAAMAACTSSIVAFSEADVVFHDIVMDVSRNRLGRAIVNSIHDKARNNVRYHGTFSAAAVKLTMREHTAIADAIARGDADAANEAMRAHIMGSWARRRPAARRYVAGH